MNGAAPPLVIVTPTEPSPEPLHVMLVDVAANTGGVDPPTVYARLLAEQLNDPPWLSYTDK